MFRKYTFQTCFTSQTFQTYFPCVLCAERKLGISVYSVVKKKRGKSAAEELDANLDNEFLPRQFFRGQGLARRVGSVLRHENHVITGIQSERMRCAVAKGNILFFIVRAEGDSSEVEYSVSFRSIERGLDVDVIAMNFGMLDGAKGRELDVGNGGVDVGAVDVVAACGEISQIGALKEIEGHGKARGKCRVDGGSGDTSSEERLGEVEWARRTISRRVRGRFPDGDGGKFGDAGAEFIKEEVREIFRG